MLKSDFWDPEWEGSAGGGAWRGRRYFPHIPKCQRGVHNKPSPEVREMESPRENHRGALTLKFADRDGQKTRFRSGALRHLSVSGVCQ